MKLNVHGPIKIALTIILSGAAWVCHSADEFGIEHNLADDKAGSHFVSVKAGGIEILKNANGNGILFQSTPAGTIAFSAGFPGMSKLGRMDSLLILDDAKDIKTFEHSFCCEDNGLKLEWVNMFEYHRDVPGVMIESRVINLTREAASCYQYWTTDAIEKAYFTASGKVNVPGGGVLPLQASAGWVFFPINGKGGVGMIVGDASGILFSNFRNGKGLWGMRTTTQGKEVFKEGQGSVLKFILFFAASSEKAKELYGKIKKENIFPGLWRKDVL